MTGREAPRNNLVLNNISTNALCIQAHPGTRINITLVDFNAPRQSNTPPGGGGTTKQSEVVPVVVPSCHKYATIVEHMTATGPEKSEVVCGRRTRIQNVFVSNGHEVQVLLETHRVNADYFILNYEG